jgi:hypothetical protein
VTGAGQPDGGGLACLHPPAAAATAGAWRRLGDSVCPGPWCNKNVLTAALLPLVQPRKDPAVRTIDGCVGTGLAAGRGRPARKQGKSRGARPEGRGACTDALVAGCQMRVREGRKADEKKASAKQGCSSLICGPSSGLRSCWPAASASKHGWFATAAGRAGWRRVPLFQAQQKGGARACSAREGTQRGARSGVMWLAQTGPSGVSVGGGGVVHQKGQAGAQCAAAAEAALRVQHMGESPRGGEEALGQWLWFSQCKLPCVGLREAAPWRRRQGRSRRWRRRSVAAVASMLGAWGSEARAGAAGLMPCVCVS